jgi:hypothetical protein
MQSIYVLRISAFNHDSEVTLLGECRGCTGAAVFPPQALRRLSITSDQILRNALDQIDWVIFYDKPFLKFERRKGVQHLVGSEPYPEDMWFEEERPRKEAMRFFSTNGIGVIDALSKLEATIRAGINPQVGAWHTHG